MVEMAGRIGGMLAIIRHIRMDAEGILRCVDEYLERDLKALQKIQKQMRGEVLEESKKKGGKDV